MSYFISILEKLDVIRLWDFQSHSAGGSAVITEEYHTECGAFRPDVPPLSLLLFPKVGLMPDWWPIIVS
jgi:hypothetical protein